MLHLCIFENHQLERCLEFLRTPKALLAPTLCPRQNGGTFQPSATGSSAYGDNGWLARLLRALSPGEEQRQCLRMAHYIVIVLAATTANDGVWPPQ